MIFVPIFLATLVALSFGAPSEDMKQILVLRELGDFLAIIPLQKIHTIMLEHLKKDDGLKAAVRFLQSEEFRAMDDAIVGKPTTKEIFRRFSEAGLNIEEYNKMFRSVIGGVKVEVSDTARASFAAYLKAVSEVLDFDALMSLFVDKLEKSPVFRKFYDEVTSEEMKVLFEKLLISDDAKRLMDKFEGMDVPIRHVIDQVFSFIGWKKPKTPNEL